MILVMKNRFYLALCAMVALAGCVKNDPADQDNLAPIAFESPLLYSSVDNKAGVAGEIGTTYPVDEKFVIFAAEHEGTFTSWSSATPCEFNGSVVSYDNTINAWAPKTANGGYFYWPDAKYISFAAVSPADLELPETVAAEYGNGGVTIENFEVQSNPAKQYDLLYSQISVNNTHSNMIKGSNSTYDGIPILFKHALSAVRFSLKKDASVTEQVVLTKLELKSVASKGTFEEKASYPAASDPTWSIDFTNVANYQAFSGSKEFAVDAALVGSTLLLLPQELKDALVLSVSYTVGDVAKNTNITLNEHPKGVVGVLPIGSWEIGNRYTYCLTYGKTSHMQDMIFFSPSVEGWVDTDVIEVVL